MFCIILQLLRVIVIYLPDNISLIIYDNFCEVLKAQKDKFILLNVIVYELESHSA